MVLNNIMKKYTQTGFTLLELMVVIAMMGVLFAVGIPSFTTMILTSELADTTNELTLSLRRARGLAIESGKEVVVCSSTNTDADPALVTCSGVTGNWTNGWAILVDRNMDGNFIGANELVWVKEMKSDTTITFTASPDTGTANFTNDFTHTVTFSHTGGLKDGTAGEFWICSGVEDGGLLRRELSVTVGGETTFTKNQTPATNC